MAKKKDQKGKKKTQSKKRGMPKGRFGASLYIHVRSHLWNLHKDKYSGSDYNTKGSRFLQTVHEVYERCKGYGSQCTDEVIEHFYNQVAGGYEGEPELNPELYTSAQPYWTIADVEWDTLMTTSPNLHFIAPDIVPAPHEFTAVDYVNGDGYADYFKEWVDYLNELAEESNPESDSLKNEYDYIFTKPKQDADGKWFSIIYPINDEGRVDDFGFVPFGGNGDYPPDAPPPFGDDEKAVPEGEPDEPDEVKKAQVEKVKAETEKIKQETRSQRLGFKLDQLYKQLELFGKLGDKKEYKRVKSLIRALTKLL